jgi:hypothetical protein
MQHRLCLDNRNEPKWSVGLEAADSIGASTVIYAAMFVPDRQWYGDELDPWTKRPGQHEILVRVQEFFVQERQLVRGGNPKDIWRIAHLDPRIRPIQVAYHWDHQDEYVRLVLAAVNEHRLGQQPVVVLLDPCNGIAEVRHRKAGTRRLRIRSRAVAAIWAGLRRGDVLVIWQSPQPERIPAHDPVYLLNQAIQRAALPQPVDGIEIHRFGPFVMLKLTK